MKRKAPWTDYDGKDIHEHDLLIHPSGQCGIIICHSECDREEDMWCVKYNDGVESRLCLQIGYMGQGVVTPQQEVKHADSM